METGIAMIGIHGRHTIWTDVIRCYPKTKKDQAPRRKFAMLPLNSLVIRIQGAIHLLPNPFPC